MPMTLLYPEFLLLVKISNIHPVTENITLENYKSGHA